MNTRRFNIIVGLLGLGLIGLILIQIFSIAASFRVEQEKLTLSLNNALDEAGKEMEKAIESFEFAGKTLIDPYEGITILKHGWGFKDGVPISGLVSDTVVLMSDNIRFSKFVKRSSLRVTQPVEADIIVKFKFFDSVKEAIQLPTAQVFQDVTVENYRDYLSGAATLAQQLDMSYVDSVISAKLKLFGIQDFTFYLKDINSGNITYFSDSSSINDLETSVFGTVLFKDSYFNRPHELKVFFPDQNLYIVQSIWGLLIVSLIVISILVYAFWYFVSTIIRQKKFSKMKNDFINNLTHEFKTPISNISLALEQLHSSPSDSNKNKLYSIISAENNRILNNVERVLLMAGAESKDPVLQMKNISVHKILEEVIEIFDLKLSNNIDFVSHFDASNDLIYGDYLHIKNTFSNLLDNAIKYTKNDPEIIVSTENEGNLIVISFQDNGIGIPEQEINRIFDSFYRVQMGDLHFAGGFGLGLSYVKNIIQSHQGKINVKSELGRGSIFSIRFNTINQNGRN